MEGMSSPLLAVFDTDTDFRSEWTRAGGGVEAEYEGAADYDSLGWHGILRWGLTAGV